MKQELICEMDFTELSFKYQMIWQQWVVLFENIKNNIKQPNKSKVLDAVQ